MLQYLAAFDELAKSMVEGFLVTTASLAETVNFLPSGHLLADWDAGLPTV